MSKVYTYSDLENIHSFIISLKRKSNRLGVKLQLTNDKHIVITDNIKCSGYFQNPEKKEQGVLAVATDMNMENWLSILVHESCHMDQWEEGCDIWKLADKLNPNIIDEWLEGKEFSDKKIDDAINSTRDLELDCEKRTIEKIKKFKLPINIDQYIQKANCYIFYHNYVRLTRTWYNINNNPITNKQIYKLCNKDWYRDYNWIPKDLLEAFQKHKI